MFCEHYAIHHKPVAAYRYAGYATAGWSTDSISVAASRVLKTDKVTLRLYELQVASTDAFRVTAAEKKQWLKQIIEESMQTVTGEDGRTFSLGDHGAAIKAISELNKMDGDLAAQKKHITGLIGITIDNDDNEL